MSKYEESQDDEAKRFMKYYRQFIIKRKYLVDTTFTIGNYNLPIPYHRRYGQIRNRYETLAKLLSDVATGGTDALNEYINRHMFNQFMYKNESKIQARNDLVPNKIVPKDALPQHLNKICDRLQNATRQTSADILEQSRSRIDLASFSEDVYNLSTIKSILQESYERFSDGEFISTVMTLNGTKIAWPCDDSNRRCSTSVQYKIIAKLLIDFQKDPLVLVEFNRKMKWRQFIDYRGKLLDTFGLSPMEGEKERLETFSIRLDPRNCLRFSLGCDEETTYSVRFS